MWARLVATILRRLDVRGQTSCDPWRVSQSAMGESVFAHMLGQDIKRQAGILSAARSGSDDIDIATSSPAPGRDPATYLHVM